MNPQPNPESLCVIILGASGMVGAAVLDECLRDSRVTRVLSLGRSSCNRQDPKLAEIIHAGMLDLAPATERLKGYNACFFTLGVSSFGMDEASYTRVTYELTLSVAKTLLSLNPDMAMCYVSGQGTDATEKGRIMWARVKGRTENALLGMGFRTAAMFRLGVLLPLKGFRSKTRIYRVFYSPLAPLISLLARAFPSSIATSRTLGRAMIKAALGQAGKNRLSPGDIYRLGC